MEKKARPQSTRILGLDYGLARIGMAISDELKIIASPFKTVTAEKKLELTVAKIAGEVKLIEDTQKCLIREIVVGIPLRMNGQMGMMADEVKHFVEALKAQVTCPVHTWDERLSTVQAERSLRESNLTRKKRSQVVDTVTAAIILQNYLDHQNLASS